MLSRCSRFVFNATVINDGTHILIEPAASTVQADSDRLHKLLDRLCVTHSTNPLPVTTTPNYIPCNLHYARLLVCFAAIRIGITAPSLKPSLLSSAGLLRKFT